MLGNISLLLGLAAIFYDGFSSTRGSGGFPWTAGPIVVQGRGKGLKGKGAVATTATDAAAIRWVNPGTLLLFFGPTAFLFVIHYCAVPIESEAADPRQFPPALARSMALTALLDIVVGCVGA